MRGGRRIDLSLLAFGRISFRVGVNVAPQIHISRFAPHNFYDVFVNFVKFQFHMMTDF